MTWDGWLANAVAFASLTVALAVALGARVKIRALRRRVEQLAAGAGPRRALRRGADGGGRVRRGPVV